MGKRRRIVMLPPVLAGGPGTPGRPPPPQAVPVPRKPRPEVTRDR